MALGPSLFLQWAVTLSRWLVTASQRSEIGPWRRSHSDAFEPLRLVRWLARPFPPYRGKRRNKRSHSTRPFLSFDHRSSQSVHANSRPDWFRSSPHSFQYHLPMFASYWSTYYPQPWLSSNSIQVYSSGRMNCCQGEREKNNLLFWAAAPSSIFRRGGKIAAAKARSTPRAGSNRGGYPR